MENKTDSMKPEENGTSSPRTIKQRRSVVGSRIYLSHPEGMKSFQECPVLLNPLKSTSMFAMETKFDDTSPRDRQANKPKIPASSNITDSCTQTSKTILQLAELETGALTPDSLMQSPRDPEFPNKKDNKVNLKEVESKLQMCPANSQYTLDGSVCEQPPTLTFIRKNYLMQYLNNRNVPPDDEVDVYSKKSLTETFLEKKQNSEAVPTCDCRTRFLQQTSPLRNLPFKNYEELFKSQSCVESYDPNFIKDDDEFQQQPPFQASRFTVKNVREQQVTDMTQPMRCYWPPANTEKLNTKIEKLFENSDIDSEECSPQQTRKNSSRRASTFMSPTIASEQRNQLHIVQNLKHLISPTRRGKSLSPNRNRTLTSKLVKKFNHEKIPYIDQSKSEISELATCKGTFIRRSSGQRYTSPPTMMANYAARPKFDEDLLRIDLQSLDIKTSEETIGRSRQPSCSVSTTSSDNLVSTTMARIRSPDWNIALRGLAEMTELCRIMDSDLLFPHMTAVNQRLLELLRSPRSHVCRTACQVAGHIFESMKDTRRPEFDDIVEILLYKTADANKFIRKDANLALDCMVTHVPIFHAVRSLCLKGPAHKNPLVRTATIRLIVCAVVITGPDIVLNLQSHEHTRKRIILHMAKFLQDKDQETRKFGERLYKVLCKESMFEACLKKYLEKEDITKMKNSLKCRR